MSFKNIVSDLSFSPAMMGQLSLLANKVKKEELIRRIGLLILLVTLIIQSLIIFQPAEQTNSLTAGEMIARGYEMDTNNCTDSATFDCIKDLNKSVVAINQSQGNIEAQTVAAEAGDHINYTVSFINSSDQAITVEPQIRLADTMEYADVIQTNDGVINSADNILSWGKTTISPKSTQTRTYIISLLDKLPTTSRGKYYKKSHDCVISNSFGNSLDVAVNCPIVKKIESIYQSLPHLDSTSMAVISIIILTASAYQYARIRQIKQEIQIIRHNANAGTI